MEIKKVHLESLIKILINLYNKGVDYIDISRLKEEDDNVAVGISFTEEYMTSEARKMNDKPKGISEDDINQLL